MRYTDQTGYTIELKKAPKRIISLVPSQSELLWDLGLKEELIGITKFCIHPGDMYETVDRIGGTKQLHLEKIKNLKPDLIIGNKEENEKEQIEALRKEFPVWLSDVNTLDEAMMMIGSVGEMTGKEKEANELAASIRTEFKKIGRENLKGKTVIYLMWYDPLMAAANHTFINAMINELGLVNACDHLTRYPALTLDQIKEIDPDYIFLSSEPFPFSHKHMAQINDACSRSKVVFVDGEMFSWYGSRLKLAPLYFAKLFEM